MKLAHISDIHCNFGTDFNEQMFDEAVELLNACEDIDLVFVSGDLTTNGLLSEYTLAQEKLKEIDHQLIIVPGNHDERNLGYKLFPEFFGKPNFIRTFKDLCFVGLSSSEPDKDDGRLGRERHKVINDALLLRKPLTIIGFHHHLIPVPNSGREKNIIEDAGETLDLILRNNIPLVLMGHRHVPFGVKLHKTLLVNAGTFSCNRTRAHFGNTFNIIEVSPDQIIVTVFNVTKNQKEKMIEFSPANEGYINRYYEKNIEKTNKQ